MKKQKRLAQKVVEVKVRPSRRMDGYLIEIEPWSVTLNPRRGAKEIVWKFDPHEPDMTLEIFFDEYWHFPGRPQRKGKGSVRSRSLSQGAPNGKHGYTIEVIEPAKGTVIRIDPDYMVSRF